jgi:hypothetical protein
LGQTHSLGKKKEKRGIFAFLQELAPFITVGTTSTTDKNSFISGCAVSFNQATFFPKEAFQA